MEIWVQGLLGLGTAFIAIVGARIGLPGTMLRLNYVDKRLKVVSSLLNQHKSSIPSADVRELEMEINYIVQEILVSSDRLKIAQLADWQQQRILKRLFILPRPRSVIGWALTLFAYTYLLLALIYIPIVLMNINFGTPDGEIERIGVIGLFGSLLLFLVLRMLSLVVARRDAGWRSRSQLS